MNAHSLDADTDAATPPALPRGPLTLVFTDIEGSTRLLQALGPHYPAQLAAHRRILRACFAAHRGVEVDTQGDAFFAVFPLVKDAINAVVQAQRELHNYSWPAGFPMRVRIGLHCGEPTRTAESYVGLDLHRCARLMSAGHGGQILLSGAAASATGASAAGTLNSHLELRDLGEHRLKDLPHPERIFELRIAGLPADFPPLRTIDNRPHNLPAHLSPIVGRAREVAALRAQLEAGASLITLLGRAEPAKLGYPWRSPPRRAIYGPMASFSCLWRPSQPGLAKVIAPKSKTKSRAPPRLRWDCAMMARRPWQSG